MGKSLKQCGACGQFYEVSSMDPAPRCPHCDRGAVSKTAKTEPAAVAAQPKPVAPPPAGPPPAAPAPKRPAVSQKPVSTPKPSHLFRNVGAVIVGLAFSGVILYYAGLLKLPKQAAEPLEKLKAKVQDTVKKQQQPDEKPAEPERPKPDEPKKETPKEPQKPPEPAGPPPEPSPDFSKETAFEVVKVEDGATVVVKGASKNITVHLMGVSVAKPDEAKAWLAAQLPKGAKVFLYYGKLDTPKWRSERDAFGSDQAWVFKAGNEAFVNLEAVKQGFAKGEKAGEFEELFRYWTDKKAQ